MILRPMKYTNTLYLIPKTLAKGKYKGKRYKITSTGMWACGYVLCQLGNVRNIRVHGGITYHKTNIIGWDYAHAMDKIGNCKVSGKKWTTREILKDVKQVIKQINEMEGKNVKRNKNKE